VYVYDQAGNPVPHARLFDEYGYPIQMGSPVCQNGADAPGSAADRAAASGYDQYGDAYDSGNGDGQPDDPIARAWTYPLCPDDPGPFRAGPGAVAQPGAVGQPGAAVVTPSPAPTPTGAPPASGAATATPASTPEATPTRPQRTGRTGSKGTR
jgi:hypothetical protein